LIRYKDTWKLSEISKTQVIRDEMCKSSYANVKLSLTSKLDDAPFTCSTIFDGEYILWSSVNAVELWTKAAGNEVYFSETESIMFDDRWGVSTSPAEFGGCWCGGSWRKRICCDALEMVLQCLSNLAKGAWMKNRQFIFRRSFDRRPNLTDNLRARSATQNTFNTHDVSVVGSASVIADCQSLFCIISGFRRNVNEFCALSGFYAALNASSVPTFRNNLLVPSARVRQ